MTMMGAGAAGGSAGPPAGGATAGGGGTGGAGATDLSQEIFDAASFPRFDLDLPKASTDALNKIMSADDPGQDSYVSATFTYDKGGKSEVVQNVGVRLKGVGAGRGVARRLGRELSCTHAAVSPCLQLFSSRRRGCACGAPGGLPRTTG